MLRISGAVGAAQALALAAAPLLTRLYSPDAMGHLAFFGAVVTILMPLASLRYDLALPLPPDERSALDLLALCLMAVVGSSLITAFLAMLAWPTLAERTGISGAEIVLLPVATFVLGLHGVVTGWMVRERAFSQIAHIRFTTTLGGVAGQIGFGQLHADPASLILGFIGGYFLGLVLGAYQCRRALANSTTHLRFTHIRRLGAEYRAFATITAPSNVINAVGAQLPSMMLPSLYGLAITGQYSLAQRVLAQPMVFLGQAVNQVLWGNAPRLVVGEPARLWPLFLRLNACLLAVMAPALVLVRFGAEIFTFVFGAGWGQAGRFAGVIVVASFLGLAAQGTTSLHIYRLNHWMCAWEAGQFLLVSGALGAAWGMMFSPMECVVAITVALAIAHVILLGLNAVAVRRVAFRMDRSADAVTPGLLPKAPAGHAKE